MAACAAKNCATVYLNLLWRRRKSSVSFSEPPGRYRVEAEHVITGMKAQTWFNVAGN